MLRFCRPYLSNFFTVIFSHNSHTQSSQFFLKGLFFCGLESASSLAGLMGSINDPAARSETCYPRKLPTSGTVSQDTNHSTGTTQEKWHPQVFFLKIIILSPKPQLLCAFELMKNDSSNTRMSRKWKNIIKYIFDPLKI